MHLLGLNHHPLKSGAIRPVGSAAVLPRGLTDDRSWMLVDREGRMISAREEHSIFRIVSDTPATDPSVTTALRLRAPGLPDLHVDVPDSPPIAVRLHSLDLLAMPAGDESHVWICRALGRDLRLVWCHNPTRRRLEPGFSEPGDHTAFADAFPVTVASLASLGRLNDWIAEAAMERGDETPAPLPVQRFRPNLVIDGDAPFAEDGWSSLSVGEVRFRVSKPVSRCVMTTVEPLTLATGKEPIRTLARRRLVEGKTLFAANLIPLCSGLLSVGDPVSAE